MLSSASRMQNMKTSRLSFFILLLAGMASWPLHAEPADVEKIQPMQRPDKNSRIAHEQLLAKAKKGRIDLYFIGDSITRRWGATDQQYKDFLANWRTNFFGWNAANFGWGGDTVQNILWRLENGELDGVNPKVIVLMAGTNNIGNGPKAGSEDAKVDEVVMGIDALLAVMKAKAPAATTLLMGITPRSDGPDSAVAMAVIQRINARLAKFDDGKRVRYLTINDRLTDKSGKLIDGMTVDGLHLSLKSYQVWADALRPTLTELLGPRAEKDQAPEPTGDPSAQRK